MADGEPVGAAGGVGGAGGDDDDYEWEYFYEDVDEVKKEQDNQDAPVKPAPGTEY